MKLFYLKLATLRMCGSAPWTKLCMQNNILHGHGGGDDDEEMPDISSISIPTPKKGRGRPKKTLDEVVQG